MRIQQLFLKSVISTETQSPQHMVHPLQMYKPSVLSTVANCSAINRHSHCRTFSSSEKPHMVKNYIKNSPFVCDLVVDKSASVIYQDKHVFIPRLGGGEIKLF